MKRFDLHVQRTRRIGWFRKKKGPVKTTFSFSPQSRAPHSKLKWRRTCGRMCPISWRADWQQMEELSLLAGSMVCPWEMTMTAIVCSFLLVFLFFFKARHNLEKKLQENWVLANWKTDPFLTEPSLTEARQRKVEINPYTSGFFFFFWYDFVSIYVDTLHIRNVLLLSANKEGNNDTLSTNGIERKT